MHGRSLDDHKTLGGKGGGVSIVSSVAVVDGTIDPRILAVPMRSMSTFCRPDRHFVHQTRRAVRCSAGRMAGEPHPTKGVIAKHGVASRQTMHSRTV